MNNSGRRFLSRIFIFFLLSISLCTIERAQSAQKQDLRWGLAAILGEPIGASAKFWIAERWAADFGLGYSWTSQARVWMDGLYHLPITRAPKKFPFHAIFGLGMRFFFSAGTFTASGPGSGIGVGARFPLGLEGRIPDTPFYIGVIFSPGLGILPKWAFVPEGALTLRWILQDE